MTTDQTISFEQAKLVKEKLKTQLGDPEWLADIKVELGPYGMCVKVVTTRIGSGIAEKIPATLDQVKVLWEVGGEIVASNSQQYQNWLYWAKLSKARGMLSLLAYDLRIPQEFRQDIRDILKETACSPPDNF